MGWDEETDFIVVGAGAAGCVVASRLSEAGRHQVTLIEAGPTDWHPYVHIPATFLYLQHDTRFTWGYKVDPQPGLGGRAPILRQGKLLGGSSSINGQLFLRGQRAEYADWVAQGCTGWSYEEVLPFFRKMESYDGGANEWRGDSGPITVSRARETHPLSRAFVEAAVELGYPSNPDFNGAKREGAGFIQGSRNGRFRAGPAQTYLRQAKRRANLRIETEALTERVLFEGKRAVGVEIMQRGQTRRIRARCEIVISCGALKSPHLLQLSGIGPAALLTANGIPVVQDLPGVGANLRDHYSIRINQRTQGVTTLNQTSRGWRVAVEAMKYIFAGSGLLAYATTTSGLFCRSNPDLAAPDLYLSFMPGSYAEAGVLEREGGMAIGVVVSHPASRGHVRLRSPDPLQQPSIDPAYLTAESDRAAMLAGIRIARRLYATRAFATYAVQETRPGKSVESDHDLLDFMHARATPWLHFAGSCRMGVDNMNMAAVAPDLSVHGVDGLRVMDASIMPGVSSGNTQAPTIMIGEKGADMVLRRWT